MRRFGVIVLGMLDAPVAAVLVMNSLGTRRDFKWGPFEGYVTDAQTGEPVVGAVCVAYWGTHNLPIFWGHGLMYDVRVAVADTKGHFTILRRSPPLVFFGDLRSTTLHCIAPGYLWAMVVATSENATLRLVRPEHLTFQQRVDLSIRNEPDDVPPEKWREVEKIVNRARLGMSLQEIDIRRVVEPDLRR